MMYLQKALYLHNVSKLEPGHLCLEWKCCGLICFDNYLFSWLSLVFSGTFSQHQSSKYRWFLYIAFSKSNLHLTHRVTGKSIACTILIFVGVGASWHLAIFSRVFMAALESADLQGVSWLLVLFTVDGWTWNAGVIHHFNIFIVTSILVVLPVVISLVFFMFNLSPSFSLCFLSFIPRTCTLFAFSAV